MRTPYVSAASLATLTLSALSIAFSTYGTAMAAAALGPVEVSDAVAPVDGDPCHSFAP